MWGVCASAIAMTVESTRIHELILAAVVGIQHHVCYVFSSRANQRCGFLLRPVIHELSESLLDSLSGITRGRYRRLGRGQQLLAHI